MLRDDNAEDARPASISNEPEADAVTAAPTPHRSLLDDASHLFDDGKTYVQAELAFQKSRAAFGVGEMKGIAAFGVGALIAVHLALIALAVGLVISLTPLLTGWGATAVVTLSLLTLAGLMGWLAFKHIKKLASAFGNDDK